MYYSSCLHLEVVTAPNVSRSRQAESEAVVECGEAKEQEPASRQEDGGRSEGGQEGGRSGPIPAGGEIEVFLVLVSYGILRSSFEVPYLEANQSSCLFPRYL